MKQLNKWQTAVFLGGGLLMVLGAALGFILGAGDSPWRVVIPWIFGIGAIGFVSMQMLQRYEGPSVTVRRLRRIMLLSDILFLAAAVLMFASQGNPLGLDQITYVQYVYQKWVIVLLIAAVLQLYSSHRLGNELSCLCLFVCAASFVSCAESYSIQGASSVSSLDGSKLYLKAIKGGKLASIDSCEVVHGKFKFTGQLDTTLMASLFMDDQNIMPVVVEQGEIVIRIDDALQKVSGSPLNELLYDFLDKHNQLENRMNELSHRESQMLLDGIDEVTINEQLSLEAAIIAHQEDSLVTHFIIDNFDNVLGPGVFMMITSGYRYPVLTPQIEEIMSKATDTFKRDPYVSEYYRVASAIQAHEQGLDVPGMPAAPPATVPVDSLYP